MNASDLTERYIAGRMDEAEELQFETAMLERPELAAEVEARQRIKAGLQRLQERGELAALTASRSGGRHTARKPLWYAVAAGLLLAVAASLLTWKSFRTSGPPFAGSLQALTGGASDAAVSGTYVLASTRTRGAETVIDVQPGAGIVRLQAILSSTESRPVIASLERTSGPGGARNLGEVALTSDSSGLIQIVLNSAEIGSGTYRLQVRPESGAAEPEDFTFTLNATN